MKIRGYRIELTEIESVLLQVPGVAQAVVDTHESSPGVVELVAYYSLRKDTSEIDKAELRDRLQNRLPGYMVPAYLEELDIIPMLPSDKADRKNLPAPTSQRSSAGTEEYTAPSNETEELLASAMAEVLGVERVSATANFFTDLGANSLLLAHFCSSTRKNTSLPSLPMRDVYQNPTIASLAGVLTDTSSPAVQPVKFPEPAENVWASTRQFVTAGIMQLLIFLGYTYLTVTLMVVGYQWAAAAPDVLQIWVRSLVVRLDDVYRTLDCTDHPEMGVGGAVEGTGDPDLVLALCQVLVREDPDDHQPVADVRRHPVVQCLLRALGAKIGHDVALFSTSVPVCTDMLTIGDGTVVRKDCQYNGYRAYRGVIQVGPVTLGKNVLVGEKTVLDIYTAMGDNTQLGHASSLQRGQVVPDNEHWHGSPASAPIPITGRLNLPA